MNAYLAEFIGTVILLVLGTSLLAGMTLNKSLSQGGNWVIITFGWGFAVMLALYASIPYSGGHLNPAVTLSLAINGMFDWNKVVPYILCQIAGAFTGATITIIFYYPQFKETPRDINTLGIFSTVPAIKNKLFNVLSEVIATFFFIFIFLLSAKPNAKIEPGLLPVVVGFLVAVIGMSFGGTTGFAINPCRDFGTRLAYTILPVPNKSDPNWSYAWVPIVGPITGAVIAVFSFNLIF